MHGFPELLHFQRWYVISSAKPKLCTFRLFINSSKQSSRDWHQWNRVSIRDTIIHLAAQNIEWAEIAVWAWTLINCISVCAWECVEIQTMKCKVTEKQTPFALTQFHLRLEFGFFFFWHCYCSVELYDFPDLAVIRFKIYYCHIQATHSQITMDNYNF